MRFYNREDAGKQLAKKLVKYKNKNVLVLAVPRGGVPVGYYAAKALDAEFDLIVPRKLPIPWDPEAGFGAVTLDTVALNDNLVQRLGLTQEEIDKIAENIRAEVKRRTKVYRGDKPFPILKNKIVIIVDDGLASGYTVLAAIKSVKKHDGVKKIIVASPVTSMGAYDLLKKEADEVMCIKYSSEIIFAVASFYENFEDLSDEEVKKYLNNTKQKQ